MGAASAGSSEAPHLSQTSRRCNHDPSSAEWLNRSRPLCEQAVVDPAPNANSCAERPDCTPASASSSRVTHTQGPCRSACGCFVLSSPLSWQASQMRFAITWIGFSVPVVVAAYVHSVNGITKRVFQLEELCELSTCSQLWSSFLTFCELICRVSLCVVVSNMLWDFGRAAMHKNGVCTCLRHVYLGEGATLGARIARLLTTICSLFTLGVGVWSTSVDQDHVPLWVAVYCHCCDIVCHACISSALVSIVFDFGVAIVRGQFMVMVTQLLTCYDTVEAHAVHGHHNGNMEIVTDVHQSFAHWDAEEEARHDRRRPCMSIVRVAFIWTMFLFVLWAFVLANYYTEEAPPWVNKMIDLLGCVCWAGLAWWIVDSIADLVLSVCCGRRTGQDDVHCSEASLEHTHNVTSRAETLQSNERIRVCPFCQDPLDGEDGSPHESLAAQNIAVASSEDAAGNGVCTDDERLEDQSRSDGHNHEQCIDEKCGVSARADDQHMARA